MDEFAEMDADTGSATTAETQDLGELLTPLLTSAFGVAYRLTGNRTDAEDLVQEAALHACRGFATFQAGTNFKAWFFRVLHNAFYSKFRKQRREGVAIDIDDAPELSLYKETRDAGLHQSYMDPAHAFMSRMDVEQVSAALEQLPDEYREVCVLYFMEDLSYESIAQAVGVPVGTVRSRLHRGRRMLQRGLWRVAVDEGIATSLSNRGTE